MSPIFQANLKKRLGLPFRIFNELWASEHTYGEIANKYLKAVLKEGLNFTLVTGDDKHKNSISAGLASIPIKNHFNHFDSCERLQEYLNSNDFPFYHIILLDLDTPDQVGMSCLKEIRSTAQFSNKIIIAYSRNEDIESVERFYIEGGNIYFTYPKTIKLFGLLLKKLMIINWQIYSSGINREQFMLKL